jgi:cyanophycinase
MSNDTFTGCTPPRHSLPAALACTVAWLTLGQWLAPAAAAPGPLVVVGGGATPPGLHRRMLELAGGVQARVLVVGLASAATNAGAPSVRAFREAGATRVELLATNVSPAALEAVRSADLVWFPGGGQTRLMRELERLGVVDAIRERSRSGAVIGGTSAGAAVMSRVMIAGNSADKNSGGPPQIAPGLGLWPEVIVDQHFVKRGREPRLMSAVKANPALLGVGIDEATAVIVRGRAFEVIGASTVTVLDARAGGEPVASVLRAGGKFSLDP